VANLYIIGGGFDVEANSLDETIPHIVDSCAYKEFGQFPNIAHISVYVDCGDVESVMHRDTVRKYESDLHDAIEAAIEGAKAESKFQSSMINDYKMGRI
jgi:hypothetical protein